MINAELKSFKTQVLYAEHDIKWKNWSEVNRTSDHIYVTGQRAT